MTHHILAIDSGGTKCDALLARGDGTVLGWGRAEARETSNGQLHVGGGGRSYKSVLKAVCLALLDHETPVLHVGTIGSHMPVSFTRYEGVGQVSLFCLSEHEPPFVLLDTAAGVVAHAGTGSFAHARRDDGRSAHFDGLGPVLGDYGSGYHVGLMALRAVGRASWHDRYRTSLVQRITDHLQLVRPRHDRLELIEYSLTPRDRSEIAGLARLVDEEARQGDAVACSILDTAAEALTETLSCALDRLEMREAACPLAGIGSVVAHCDYYWQHFVRRAAELAPNMTPHRINIPPVVGAALFMLYRHGRDEDRAALRARLMETYPAALREAVEAPQDDQAAHARHLRAVRRTRNP